MYYKYDFVKIFIMNFTLDVICSNDINNRNTPKLHVQTMHVEKDVVKVTDHSDKVQVYLNMTEKTDSSFSKREDCNEQDG